MLMEHPRLPLATGLLTAVLALVTAAYSIAEPSIYKPLVPDQFIPGSLSQDTVSFFAAIGIIYCSFGIRTGREKLWLIWLGLVGYLAYAYGLYAFDRVTNPLFLIYVAILGLAIYSVIGFFARASKSAISATSAPRRSVAVLFGALVLMFTGLWLSILIPAMMARVPPDANSIFVMDFAFVLPLLVLEARWLWRSETMGDVLAVPLLIKTGTLGVSVLLGVFYAPVLDQPMDVAAIPVYALLGLGPLALAVPFYRAVRIA